MQNYNNLCNGSTDATIIYPYCSHNFCDDRSRFFAPKIISQQNSVISEINFIISHVGFESPKLSTSVRPLFIGVIPLLRDNDITPENKCCLLGDKFHYLGDKIYYLGDNLNYLGHKFRYLPANWG